jgi:D-glycero-alpha-D-manno-heptose-7-phosphate kinase
MIIARSPLRITLGGGGTDLPSYYRRHTGFVIAAAIDRHVFITLHRTLLDELILKYSRMERVRCVEEVQHPIIREALRLTETSAAGLEITSVAGLPAGTGLGSSGSFTTALLEALCTSKKAPIGPSELAEQACHIEIDRLAEPVGKQDQYIAAFGGLRCFRFLNDDRVETWPLRISQQVQDDLEDNLLLFFTGFSRSASRILAEQAERSNQNDQEMLDNLHFIKELGYQSKEALESGDLVCFAELMNVHWQYKRKRSKGMSNDCVDAWYEQGLANGALGGKLVGAGGGGFLLFYAEEKSRLRGAMAEAGLREVRFRFDFEGTRTMVA